MKLKKNLALASAVAFLSSLVPAAAFTSTDANTLMNAFNTAFYVANGGNGYVKKNKSGGDTGFWTQAEIIEGVIDASERNSTYNSMVSSLLNGFASQRGTSWSGNSFNDDIMWACIANLRGYQRTGNTTYRSRAKSNFDMCYARAWDTSAGGLWWTTSKTSKNSCVMGPGSIAAYLLYQTLGDSGYLTKAIAINDWQRAHCYNESNGQVYDSTGSQTPTTYNQGTFIRACQLRGSTGGAQKACDYLMTMGGTIINGYHIMSQYATGGDGSGFNGIAVRWAARLMKDLGLQSKYQGWLQTNAQQAWNVRRTSDNLSWCLWGSTLQNGTVVGSWDCINSVIALQVVPPTQ